MDRESRDIDSARAVALRLLAVRDLSEAQLRQRLGRRGYDRAVIDEAIRVLTDAGHLDDRRAAAAIARLESGVRRRGRRRVQQRLAAAGIPAAIAEHALAEAFEQVDTEALLRAAVDRRLPPGRPIADRRELARLFRHLVGQGFEPARVLALLRSRRDGAVDDEPLP